MKFVVDVYGLWILKANQVKSLTEESECEEQVYVRGDSRSYTILLTSRAVKALEGAGLELPPNLLNLLVGSCVHQANGKKVRIDAFLVTIVQRHLGL